jgi:hypothetical protein
MMIIDISLQVSFLKLRFKASSFCFISVRVFRAIFFLQFYCSDIKLARNVMKARRIGDRTSKCKLVGALKKLFQFEFIEFFTQRVENGFLVRWENIFINKFSFQANWKSPWCDFSHFLKSHLSKSHVAIFSSFIKSDKSMRNSWREITQVQGYAAATPPQHINGMLHAELDYDTKRAYFINLIAI